MKGLDLGQTSNPSLAWKMDVFKINDDDDDEGCEFKARLLDFWLIARQPSYTQESLFTNNHVSRL